MIPISQLASSVQASATLTVAMEARQLKAEGKTIYDFSLGEPDFSTPPHICDAAYRAMQQGHTHYTATAGIAELRAAICRRYSKMGLNATPDQVVVSNGVKHSIHIALVCLVGPGDEVIIPTPYWVSYSDLVQMTSAKAVLVNTDEESGFKMSPAQLRKAITPRSKLLMINSPCNPTGAVYSRAELEALADVVLDSHIGVLSDEIYEKLVYGDARTTCFASMRPELAPRTITVSGVSKSYAMTGWRMGWAVGPQHVMKAMANVQSQETSSPCSISQYATLAALNGDQQCTTDMLREFAARRELVVRRLGEMPGIRCFKPDGAFYAFFNVTALYGKTLGGRKITDSASFCRVALETAHVSMVPGSFFGADGYVRLSFATNRAEIAAGLDKLAQLLT